MMPYYLSECVLFPLKFAKDVFRFKKLLQQQFSFARLDWGEYLSPPINIWQTPDPPYSNCSLHLAVVRKASNYRRVDVRINRWRNDWIGVVSADDCIVIERNRDELASRKYTSLRLPCRWGTLRQIPLPTFYYSPPSLDNALQAFMNWAISTRTARSSWDAEAVICGGRFNALSTAVPHRNQATDDFSFWEGKGSDLSIKLPSKRVNKSSDD